MAERPRRPDDDLEMRLLALGSSIVRLLPLILTRSAMIPPSSVEFADPDISTVPLGA